MPNSNDLGELLTADITITQLSGELCRNREIDRCLDLARKGLNILRVCMRRI